MLQLFKSNHFLNTLLLLPIALALHASIYIYGQEVEATDCGIMGFYLLDDWTPTYFWHWILASGVVFFQAVFINRLSIIHRLNNEVNILPGLLWILWSAFHPGMMGLQANSLALLFILPGMSQLMKCYKNRRSALYLFNAGFFFSLSSLLFFPVSWLILFGFLAMFTMGSVRFPEPQQFLVGLITPYLLSFFSVYYFESAQEFVFLQWEQQEILGVFEPWDLVRNEYISGSIFVLFSLIALVNLQFYQAKKEIFAQRKVSLLFVYLLFGFLGVIFLSEFDLNYLLIILWPLTILLSDNLYQMKNPLAPELFLWLLIAYSFFMQYQTLF